MCPALNRQTLNRTDRILRATLNNQFLDEMIQISNHFKTSIEELVFQIDTKRHRGQKLSTAIRVYVFDFYRAKNNRAAPSQSLIPDCSVRRESLLEGERLMRLAREVENLRGKIKHQTTN